MELNKSLSPFAVRLGYAGLIPQLIFLILAAAGDGTRWIAQAGSFAYAALIFSFLGGLWWAQAAASPNPKPWQYAIAVAPSLIGLACFMPWVWGLSWPKPYLAVLGLLLAMSPVIDMRLDGQAHPNKGWSSLRLHLSFALGLTTILISIL